MNKLFAAINTILIPFTPLFCMVLCWAFASRDIVIHNFSAHRAITDRRVCIAMIEIWTDIVTSDHSFFLSGFMCINIDPQQCRQCRNGSVAVPGIACSWLISIRQYSVFLWVFLHIICLYELIRICYSPSTNFKEKNK